MKMQNMVKVEVDYKSLPNDMDYPFLANDLDELAKELLFKYFGVRVDTLELGYSLSYSQGDGAWFGELNFNEEDSEIIWNKYAPKFDFPIGCFYVDNNRGCYFHETGRAIGFETTELIENDEIGAECNRIEELFVEDIQKICREIRDAGYAYMKEENKRELGRVAVEKFFEVNDIVEEPYEQDPCFEGEQGEDAFCIGTADGVNVYIVDLELVEHTRTTMIDGKVDMERKFYTF